MEALKTVAKGFNPISFTELQEEMQKIVKANDKTQFELAVEMDVKSISTIHNILTNTEQNVSDEMLTKFINLLGLNAFVAWQNGERIYYIKN